MTVDPSRVSAAADALRRRIEAAGGSDVELVAVTKGFVADAIDAVVAAGCRAIGENYAQELRAKGEAVAAARRQGVAVHFIGQVQSNKVRLVAGVVDVWESVDRRSLVGEIARRAPGATVLVQVDATGEPGKGGCAPGEVGDLVAACRQAGLDVDGLMTVGPTGGGGDDARSAFRTTRRLVDDLGLRTCSMGMTDDLELAIEEGSTRVRVGTALLGSRPR